MYAMMLMRKAKSWFTGYNSNVPGHEQGTIRYLVYNGGAPKYVGIINATAAKGYEGVVLGSGKAPPSGFIAGSAPLQWRIMIMSATGVAALPAMSFTNPARA
jgi:hypothetical protein